MRAQPSLLWRLTALFSLLSVAVVSGFAVLVVRANEQHFLDLDHATLLDKSQLIAEILQHASSPTEAQSRLGDALGSSPEMHALVQRASGETFFQSPHYPRSAHDPLSAPANNRTAMGSPTAASAHDGSGRTVEWVTQAQAPFAAGERFQVTTVLETAHHDNFMVELQRRLIAYSALAMLVATALAALAARRGLKPLRTMQEKAQQVSGHRLKARMPIESVPLEFAQLAQDLNQMLERIDDDVQRLIAFSSDLAHELRTPINNLLTQSQVALATPREAAAYRDILGANVEELQHLARTVADMLYLAKTERGVDWPHREQVEAEVEVTRVFDFYEALAEDRGLQLEQHGAATVFADRLMLRRALSNLLSNAIRHASSPSTVEVWIDGDAVATRLAVRNQGPTIAPDVLPLLFERFYRGDTARTHPHVEGTGLGLAITRAIAQAHGGDIGVTSVNGTTVFTLSLPNGRHRPNPSGVFVSR